jgi:transcriptional regulator with XRE-family HTH domain/3-hydroxymyristoyl/3-hydroxydecanoyl-(acyl carrier protein) dehydratase
MGSSLPFDQPMHFRNLGGRATVLAQVAGGEAVDTRVRFIRGSRLGEMVIQHYEFECASGGRPVYHGHTHFGFFSPGALARQAGLANVKDIWPARPEPAALTDYPQGPAFPAGRWRLLEKIALDPQGGPAGLGSAFTVTRVDPRAWFFQAHFHQDPVCPGSLGLESLLQAGKALAALIFGASEDAALNWAAPFPRRPHEWLYRGQVTPAQKETTVKLIAREADMAQRLLTVDGLLMADDLPIYKMEGFTICLNPSPIRRRVAAPPSKSLSPARPASGVTGGMILNWRKAKNLSQGQLAKLIGVTPIYISLMERGQRNVSASMAEKLNALFQADGEETPPISDAGGARPSLTRLQESRREGQAAPAGLLRPEDLRARRQARGLSQVKLAEAAGVTVALIGLIERGKHVLSLELAQKILAVLKE